MVNLNNVQVGSVVLNMVEDVPASISGATLWNMVDNERIFTENYTGDNIGNSIGDKYQPAIISLTIASVLDMMELTGADTSSLKLGDLTVSKGGQSNTNIAGSKRREDGMRKLEILGQQSHFFKSLG